MATTVTDPMPVALENVTWTCAAIGRSGLHGLGRRAASATAWRCRESRATYLATGTVAATATGTLSNTATVTLATDLYRQSATDVDVVAAAMSYFVIDACRLVDTRRPEARWARLPAGAEDAPAPGLRSLRHPRDCPGARPERDGDRIGAAGHVRLFPTGQPIPTIATLTTRRVRRGGNAIVALSANGEFSA